MHTQTPKKTKKKPSSSSQEPVLPGGTQSTPPKTTQPTLRGRALRLLGRRECSRQELDKRLRAYSQDANELAALLDDLAARGWLSDVRFADAVVRRRTGQFARRAIAQELKKAGVDEDVRAAALAEFDPEMEFVAALALCRRKFRSAPSDAKEKARQIRFLQSRGYSLSLALRVLKQTGTASEET